MTVSVVVTTYKRDKLLWKTICSISGADEVIVVDDAASPVTEALCRHIVDYIPRTNRPDTEFSNPAVPINIGLKAAKGDIIILQNAECLHQTLVVEQMRERVKEKEAVFAQVESLDKDGNRESWYVHPTIAPRPYFFCGAMLKKHFDELGGMDEEFTGPGFEDDDFALRMQRAGIVCKFSDDILVSHQWHERPVLDFTPSNELYRRKHGVSLWW